MLEETKSISLEDGAILLAAHELSGEREGTTVDAVAKHLSREVSEVRDLCFQFKRWGLFTMTLGGGIYITPQGRIGARKIKQQIEDNEKAAR